MPTVIPKKERKEKGNAMLACLLACFPTEQKRFCSKSHPFLTIKKKHHSTGKRVLKEKDSEPG
jgi:hypothetical protein